MAARDSEIDPQQFAMISKALAEPSRFEMLQKIGASKKAPTCTCVREWLDLSPATISHHLKELENAGLVEIRRDGKFAYISVRRDVLRAYVDALSKL